MSHCKSTKNTQLFNPGIGRGTPGVGPGLPTHPAVRKQNPSPPGPTPIPAPAPAPAPAPKQTKAAAEGSAFPGNPKMLLNFLPTKAK